MSSTCRHESTINLLQKYAGGLALFEACMIGSDMEQLQCNSINDAKRGTAMSYIRKL